MNVWWQNSKAVSLNKNNNKYINSDSGFYLGPYRTDRVATFRDFIFKLNEYKYMKKTT